jgi:hypothetical protein
MRSLDPARLHGLGDPRGEKLSEKTNKYSMVLFTVIHFDSLGLTVTGMGAVRSINRLFLSFEGDLGLVVIGD